MMITINYASGTIVTVESNSTVRVTRKTFTGSTAEQIDIYLSENLPPLNMDEPKKNTEPISFKG